jgi:DNA-nicking Smr family endonuclease
MKQVAQASIQEPVHHSCSPEVERKAGKTTYHIVVGSEEFLYKSSKSSRQIKTPLFGLDLHGCTREEAMLQLNDSLPNWINEAMKEHPSTVRVDIITGGGHQILHWIRENKQVANRFL